MINRLVGGNSGDYSMEMDPATLPVIYTRVADMDINMMHGYVSDIDASLLRDSVTPLVDGEIVLVVDSNQTRFDKMEYEVRSGDSSSLVEEGDVTGFEKDKRNNKVASLKPRMTLKEGEDYILKLTMKVKGNVDITYYTHLINKNTTHLEKELEFVKSINTALLDKSEAEEYKKYLESDPAKVSNDLGNVDITDSFEAITYGDMKPQLLYNPEMIITEMGDDIANVRMKFNITAESSKSNTEYYEVCEDYRVRYTATRMYLLSYNRTISSIYDPIFTSSSNNGLKMGITNSSDVSYITANNNKLVAFVKNRELYLYDYQHVQMYQIFSFMQEEYGNIFNNYNHHDIQLISLDNDGNLSFAVYGYMNRGNHEGENGVLLYSYDMETKQIEERAFIPTAEPYSTLKEDVTGVCYMNDEDDVYITLSGVLYVVHMDEQRFEVLMESVTNDRVVSSEDHHLLGVSSVDRNSVIVRNLANGDSMSVSSDAEDRVRVIGFVADDLVLGRVRIADIVEDSSRVIEPIYEVDIINWSGKVIKSYEPPKGKLVMSVSVKNNLVEMKLSKKRGDIFVDSGSDWIMSNDDDDANMVTLDYIYNTVRYKELYIIYPNNLYITDIPELAIAKETRVEENRTFEIESDAKGALRYFIYKNGEIVESVEAISDAIIRADEVGGGVVNSMQRTVWEKSAIHDYAIVGENVTLLSSNKEQSLAACVAMALVFEGKTASLDDVVDSSDDAISYLGENLDQEVFALKGCSLDQMKFYICKGHPVIAKMSGGYVLITSYNSQYIRYYDPVRNEVMVEDYSSVEADIVSSGNEYYAYSK
ncbi:MAG: hypothetical protein K5656_03170 [Lachnospiraceae bacterium]|nr:hypothetical protein [Lachnospiraceae bacterium]